MKHEVFNWPQNSPLTEAYLQQDVRVSPLYEYDPWGKDVLEQRAIWLDHERKHLQADRRKISEVLYKYNLHLNNAAEALQHVLALKDEQTLVVVGGQQAGLFTGPMLVVHKAITLIQAAKQASARLKRTVVPVFWIAGEDHDFDEVNHLIFLSANAEIQRIRMDHPTGLRSSISQLQLSVPFWKEAIEQLDQSLVHTEFKAELMEKLHQISLGSDTLVDFFGKVLAWLFGKHGLILMNSDDPALRQLEGPMFQQIITEHALLNEAFMNSKRQIEALGYQLQADVTNGNANVFVFEQGERLLLHKVAEGFADKKGQVAYSEAELMAKAESSPVSFSNNVLTRPLMQEYLFPTLCVILGSGETAYWAQTKEAFATLGMRMPIILPRLQITLVEGTIQKHMRKFELTFADVVQHFDEMKNKWLADQDNMQLEQHFAEIKGQFAQMYQPIMELISEINPNMRKLGQTNRDKILEQIQFLEAKSIDAFQLQFDSALRQLERIRLSLLPLGKPQERVYNIFAYLNKYGIGILEEMMDTPMDIDGKHHILYM